MNNNSDIDKIDEQIKMLQSSSNDELHKQVDDSGDVVEKTAKVFVDEMKNVEVLSDNDLEATKQIDNLDNLTSSENNGEKEQTLPETEPLTEVSTQPVEVDSKSEDKKKNKKKFLIVFLVIFVVLSILFTIFVLIFVNKSDENKGYTLEEQEEIIEGYGDLVKGTINNYKTKREISLKYEEVEKLIEYDYKVKCKIHELYEDGNIYLNKCSIDGFNTKYSYGKKQVVEKEIISDDAVKIYVSKADGKATLDKPDNLDNYDVYGYVIIEPYKDLDLLGDYSDYIYYCFSTGNGVTGMPVCRIINYKTGKKALEDVDYDNIYPIKNGDKYDSKYVVVYSSSEKNEGYDLYDLVNNKKINNETYSYVLGLWDNAYKSVSTSGSGIIVQKCVTKNDGGIISHYNDCKYGLVNYSNGNTLVNIDFESYSYNTKYIYFSNKNEFGHLYDYNGKEYFSNEYPYVLGIADDKYILVNSKGSVKVIDIKGNELYNFGNKYNISAVDYYSSHFGIKYKNGALFMFVNPKYKGELGNDWDASDGCIKFIYDNDSKSGEMKTSRCGY